MLATAAVLLTALDAPLLPDAPAAPARNFEEPAPRWASVAVQTTALLVTMRATEAWIWSHPFADAPSTWPSGYRDSFTQPPLFDPSRRFFEWDGDAWYVNAIGHGIFGSELYFRPRVCGFGVLGSFAWAAGATAMWEYGFEGNRVRPSALDLVWTPLAGLALGELRFALFKAVSRNPDRAVMKLARAMVDPFGEIEHVITGHGCSRESK